MVVGWKYLLIWMVLVSHNQVLNPLQIVLSRHQNAQEFRPTLPVFSISASRVLHLRGGGITLEKLISRGKLANMTEPPV